MGDYHIFPQARSSEIAKYNKKELPRIPPNHPSQVYFSKQSSASYESIIDHRIPSPFLCDQAEIQEIWSRASTLSESTPSLPTSLTRSDSRYTLAETTRSKYRRSSAQLQTLLPPALEYRYSDHAIEVVPCRLSSASTEDLSFSPSPVAAKRSATPDLLHKLSTDLEGLSFAERIAQSNCESAASTAPTTPDESFSSGVLGHSPVIYRTVNYNSSASSTTTLDMGDYSPPASPRTATKRSKPSNIFTSTKPGHRNISSPLPSPHYPADSGLYRCDTNESATDPNYRPYRPAPSVPNTPVEPVVEVSCIDWDDDDLSKLARVKKSIGDLRNAAIRAPKTSSKDRKTEKVTIAIEKPTEISSPPRPRAQRSMTAPTEPLLNIQQQGLPVRPSLSHTMSATRIRASLPPLPTRTSSTRAVPTVGNTNRDASAQPAPPQKISRKISVRVATATTPTRKRATSDAPITQSHSLFPPSTPATSPPSIRSSRQMSHGSLATSATTPSSSPRSTTTAATTISSTTTAVNGRSRQSSIATASLTEKPLPIPTPTTTHRKRPVIRPATGSKRFSMLSFVSVRSTRADQAGTTTKTSKPKKSATATPRTRVVGLSKFRRWWRWVSRCSTVPTIAASASTVSLAGGKQGSKKAGGRKASQPQIVRVASPVAQH